MKRMLLLSLLIFALLIPQALSATYADIDSRVHSDGSVDIDGLTNYDNFINYEDTDFLNYDGKYWTLNITTEEEFSDAIYKIELPEGVVVNYIRVPDMLTIDNKHGRLTIVGTAHNQKLQIQIQYTAEQQTTDWWIFLVIIAVGISLLVWGYLMKSPEQETYAYKGLTERQKQIIGIIRKNPEGITQAEIENLTKLPKSSLSRNIDTLVRKELVHKEQSGMSNKLFLKK